MSYTALYRKYRPTKFSDVIGQETTIKILQKSILEGKIGHAYIFSGPRGTGKTSIAKIMARAVNCLNPIEGDLCGKCENCVNLKENDNDIIEIDAASNNGVDEIREIRNNAKLVPNIGKYKIYIIDEVHMLSTGAFNAILKTLEEPPAHVIFILATTEIQKIPLTILSRCQKFDFHKIKPTTMKERLMKILKEEEKIVEENIIDLIVKLSDGCCRDAINLLDQIISLEGNITENDVYDLSGDISDKYLFDMIDSIVNKDYQLGLETIKYLTEGGKNLTNAINKMLIIFRNISIIKYNSKIFDADEVEKYNKYFELDENYILGITKLLLELSGEIKKSTMQQLVFEIYFMQMCNVSLVEVKNAVFISKECIDSQPEIENKVSSKILNESEVEIKENNNFESKNKLRIGNALARADKSILKEVQAKYSNIDEYSSNKTFNNAFSILEEGNIVVASDEYLILQFEYDSTVSLFYKNLKEVEELVKKVLGKKYRLAALTKSNWNDLKKEYINNRSKFVYQYEGMNLDEPVNEDVVSDEINSVFDIFGEDAVTIK